MALPLKYGVLFSASVRGTPSAALVPDGPLDGRVPCGKVPDVPRTVGNAASTVLKNGLATALFICMLFVTGIAVPR
jgi:hypothetical protein